MYATKNGYLGLLKWVRDVGAGWRECTQGTSLCSHAAGRGHLEVLKSARQNGCGWDCTTCSSAAAGGHLEVLKWARQNGCEWDSHTCSNAALGGHLEVLKWQDKMVVSGIVMYAQGQQQEGILKF